MVDDHQEPGRRSHHSRRRQVHQPPGLVQVHLRGAHARRHRQPRPHQRSSKVESEDIENQGAEKRSCTDVDGILVPGGFGIRGTVGKVQAIRVCAREQDTVFRDMPRAAVLGDRVRAERPQPQEGQLARVRPLHAHAGHHAHGRAAKRRRHGRHDASRRIPVRPGRRGRSRKRPTASARSPSATATATSSTTPIAKRARTRGLLFTGLSPDGETRGNRGNEGPSVVSGGAVPSGVQVASRLSPHPLFAAFVAAARERRSAAGNSRA